MKRLLNNLKKPHDNKINNVSRSSLISSTIESSDPSLVSNSNNNHTSKQITQQKLKEIKQTIEDYNKNTRGLPLTIEKDGIIFSGFIKVRLNLKNPVKICNNNLCLKNVVSNMKKSTNQSTRHRKNSTNDKDKNNEQFQMIKIPAGTLTVLHITSSTTTEQVLKLLFDKYNIDGSTKLYQLYAEVTNSEGIIEKRPLKWQEYPLNYILVWGPNDQNHFLVLEEFYSYILDEFSLFEVPELLNFIKIINKERDTQLNSVTKKYKEYKIALENMLVGK